VHWITGKDLPENACDTIPIRKLVGAACVLDVCDEVNRDPDFLLTPERIEQWEEKYGEIPPHSWLLLRTDWCKRTNPKDFINADENGPHSPGFTPAASRFLALKRNVLGVGVETIGTDAGQGGRLDPPFPNHNIMHGAGKFGLASLSNLDRLPPTGAIVIAAPLKIVKGSGSPARVIALVEH
jgi:kynurenine formamidase